MSAPETILHQGKNMGKGKSVETIRRTAAKNNKIPGKTENTAGSRIARRGHPGRKI